MVDLKFEPAALTVERGQTVTFVNRGKVTHNAKGKDFFSRVVEPGGSYRHTVDRAGTVVPGARRSPSRTFPVHRHGRRSPCPNPYPVRSWSP